MSQTQSRARVSVAASTETETTVIAPLPGWPPEAVKVSLSQSGDGFRIEVTDTIVAGRTIAGLDFEVTMPAATMHDLESTKATMKDGLLTLTVPKKTPKTIAVTAG